MDKEQLSMGKKYYTITYGCQMNESDTERINGQLEELGYRPAEEMEDADIVIMNTCSVRQNAEEKVYGKIGEIKKLKDKNPDMLLGIAGCMAQENKGKLIERMPIIDFVIGPYHIHDLKDIVSKENARGGHVVKTERNPHSVEDYSELKSVRKSKIFAWVPIMQGCNKFCTTASFPMLEAVKSAVRLMTFPMKSRLLPMKDIRKLHFSGRMSILTGSISGTEPISAT